MPQMDLRYEISSIDSFFTSNEHRKSGRAEVLSAVPHVNAKKKPLRLQHIDKDCLWVNKEAVTG